MDPLAEKMPSWSSYSYAFSNPVIYADPTGMAPEVFEEPPTKFVTESGETIADTDDGSDEVYVIREDNESTFKEDLQKNIKTKDDE